VKERQAANAGKNAGKKEVVSVTSDDLIVRMMVAKCVSPPAPGPTTRRGC